MKFHLKQIRTEECLTIEELAKRANIAKSSVERIEMGIANPTLTTMCKLAKTLGVSVHELFDCD